MLAPGYPQSFYSPAADVEKNFQFYPFAGGTFCNYDKHGVYFFWLRIKQIVYREIWQMI
jgi:hypothetical protein